MLIVQAVKLQVTILLLTLVQSSSAQNGARLSSLPKLRATQPSDGDTLLSKNRSQRLDRESSALAERTPTFTWYSHVYNLDHLRQWNFGDQSSRFNISISTCVDANDVAGIYQYENDTTNADATLGDIIKDLQDTSNHGALALANVLAASREIQNPLKVSMLCSTADSDQLWQHLLSDQPNHDVTVLINSGAVTTIAMMMTSDTISTNVASAVKMGVAAYAAVAIIVINNILRFYNEKRILARIEEAFMACIFVARARLILWQARLTGVLGGSCLTASQVIAAISRIGQFSDPGLGIVPVDGGNSNTDSSQCP